MSEFEPYLILGPDLSQELLCFLGGLSMLSGELGEPDLEYSLLHPSLNLANQDDL